MTVLSALQSAAVRLVGRKPTTFFSTTNQLEVELADLATETAVDIARQHDWQALTKLQTSPGDAVTVAFPLPSDYDRLPKKADVHSTRWNTARFTPARDLDQWLDFQTQLAAGAPGFWIILEGQMQVWPAMAVSDAAKYYYISNRIVTDADTTSKTGFTKDDDVFKLEERLITLGVIWRWRAQKRLEYAEDMKNFEIALGEAIGKDKGQRPIIVGRRRMSVNADYSWPGTIVP